jgi:hypothetical protein
MSQLLHEIQSMPCLEYLTLSRLRHVTTIVPNHPSIFNFIRFFLLLFDGLQI